MNRTKELTGFNIILFKGLLRLEDRIKKIEELFGAKEYLNIIEDSHKYKGAYGNLKAFELGKIFEELEKAAKICDEVKIKTLIEKLNIVLLYLPMEHLLMKGSLDFLINILPKRSRSVYTAQLQKPMKILLELRDPLRNV